MRVVPARVTLRDENLAENAANFLLTAPGQTTLHLFLKSLCHILKSGWFGLFATVVDTKFVFEKPH